jgi:hypothetical protein
MVIGFTVTSCRVGEQAPCGPSPPTTFSECLAKTTLEQLLNPISSEGDATGSGDAGPGDTGAGDAEPSDAGPGDAGPGDVEPGDAGPGDVEPGDAGAGDATASDAMVEVRSSLVCPSVVAIQEPPFSLYAGATVTAVGQYDETCCYSGHRPSNILCE